MVVEHYDCVVAVLEGEDWAVGFGPVSVGAPWPEDGSLVEVAYYWEFWGAWWEREFVLILSFCEDVA